MLLCILSLIFVTDDVTLVLLAVVVVDATHVLRVLTVALDHQDVDLILVVLVPFVLETGEIFSKSC